MAEIGVRPDDSTIHFETPRKKRQRNASVMSVNLTPAIDITFNLLIFFLVATTFKTAEGILPSEVPTDQGILDATPLPISPIKIRIHQIGEGPSDYRIAIDNWRRQPATFLDLTPLLEGLLDKPGFDQDTPVVVFPEGDVRWDHVVNCFNAIRRVNVGAGTDRFFRNIVFASGS